ncbi:ABC transporter permease [Mangrovactinospora gilvigrisea]|uniref:ABC transporter permease n=1 Tax=Mangrovactinospora gilvigrisea TaxID=1428644 RepID=A0A1J7BHU6_9ACTN|nr:ABC transporter permease subunit [Mangrovactinospora gilvigrisea]OIV38267.1 ABC transporter permease [Mangrovactinospora gilvigrisea]
MLVPSRTARRVIHLLFLVAFVPVFALPFAVIVVASFAGAWSGALPSHPTLGNYAAATSGDSLHALLTSLITAVAASLIALTVGTWAALAADAAGRGLRRVLDGAFVLPVAVPSVVVGLGLLVAFSKPPLLLNGTPAIVIAAHTVLVTAFAYQSVRAAATRLDPAFAQAAAGLGATPLRVLLRIRLPLLLPSLTAAAGLCFALSMGELSATMMLYPPSWTPLPIRIFALTDRGSLFSGAALAVLLMAATLAVLLAVGRIRTRADHR